MATNKCAENVEYATGGGHSKMQIFESLLNLNQTVHLRPLSMVTFIPVAIGNVKTTDAH